MYKPHITIATVFTCMSLIQLTCDSTELHDKAATLTLRLVNSGMSLATAPNSVVHTGVKSAGCEKRTPQLCIQ